MSRKHLPWLPIFVAALCGSGVLPLAAPEDASAPPLQSEGAWVNVTGNLANMPSECGTLTILSPVPSSDMIIAGVAGKGLWVNKSGSMWSPLGTGAGSAVIENRPSWITYDPDRPGVFWEAGIYNKGGLYRTADYGNTFQRLGSVAHNDYVSVDFRDPNRQTLLAGGHEQGRTLWRSTDGGQSWTDIGASLPANANVSGTPLIVNAQTYLINAPGSGAGAGIYRSTNAGTSWQLVSPLGPFGPPLVGRNSAIYWPFGGGLLKSTDSGVTWTRVGSNLEPVPPIELSNGRLISFGGGRLVISADGGSTWAASGPPLPFVPSGLIYSPRRQAFFIWRAECANVVLPNAVMSLALG